MMYIRKTIMLKDKLKNIKLEIYGSLVGVVKNQTTLIKVLILLTE